MLDSVGLVQMNGRVYNSVTGRFISADPYIDGAMSSQGWNRYSYVGNRALSGTDPSGFGGDDLGRARIQLTYSRYASGSRPYFARERDEEPFESYTCNSPPPISDYANRDYVEGEENYHSYEVETLVGYNLSDEEKTTLFNSWRNGPNAAPGIRENASDGVAQRLPRLLYQSNQNWVYLITDEDTLSWKNITLQGHYFDPGTVENSVITKADGGTYLRTFGEGITDRFVQNELLGKAFFKAAQVIAAADFNYGDVFNDVFPDLAAPSFRRFGPAGACNDRPEVLP